MCRNRMRKQASVLSFSPVFRSGTNAEISYGFKGYGDQLVLILVQMEPLVSVGRTNQN
jgi:hypothetical protein